jgi:hypothetical protein
MEFLKKYQFQISIVILIAAIATYYFLFVADKDGKALTRESAIKIIKDAGKHSMANDSIFGTEYLIEWAKAVKDKKPSFIYDGKTYNAQGGTALK